MSIRQTEECVRYYVSTFDKTYELDERKNNRNGSIFKLKIKYLIRPAEGV